MAHGAETMQAAGSRTRDARQRRATPRRAVAVGELEVGADVLAQILARRLTGGDALALAELAGVQGAKQAAATLPLRLPTPLQSVRVRCAAAPTGSALRAYCEVAAEACEDVDTEALAGVNTALLALFDLCREAQPSATLQRVRVLFREGGRDGLWRHPSGLETDETDHYRPQAAPRIDGWATAVLTLSDRAASGAYADRSGPLLVAALEALGAKVVLADVLPDDHDALAHSLRRLAAAGTGLVLTTGGTGLGARDVTPEALAQVASRPVPGLAEMLRAEGSRHTPLAWLSRAGAALVERTLVVSLPGSPRAVEQGMAVLAPLLAHARAMLDGGAHP